MAWAMLWDRDVRLAPGLTLSIVLSSMGRSCAPSPQMDLGSMIHPVQASMRKLHLPCVIQGSLTPSSTSGAPRDAAARVRASLLTAGDARQLSTIRVLGYIRVTAASPRGAGGRGSDGMCSHAPFGDAFGDAGTGLLAPTRCCGGKSLMQEQQLPRGLDVPGGDTFPVGIGVSPPCSLIPTRALVP